MESLPKEVATEGVPMFKGVGKLVVGIVLVGVGVFGALAATGLAGDGLEEAVKALSHSDDAGASRKAS
jgi:hypothetical protein